MPLFAPASSLVVLFSQLVVLGQPQLLIRSPSCAEKAPLRTVRSLSSPEPHIAASGSAGHVYAQAGPAEGVASRGAGTAPIAGSSRLRVIDPAFPLTHSAAPYPRLIERRAARAFAGCGRALTLAAVLAARGALTQQARHGAPAARSSASPPACLQIPTRPAAPGSCQPCARVFARHTRGFLLCACEAAASERSRVHGCADTLQPTGDAAGRRGFLRSNDRAAMPCAATHPRAGCGRLREGSRREHASVR